MKVNDALKLIDEGWVKKPKGYRVRFQKNVHSNWVADFVPGEKETPLDSDVVAWRLAWKLSIAGKPGRPEKRENDIVNVYVVDDTGNPIKYYATNRAEVFNQIAAENL